MQDGMRRFLLHKIQDAPQQRSVSLAKGTIVRQDYNESVSANRKRLRQIIGAVDSRVPPIAPELFASSLGPSELLAVSATRDHGSLARGDSVDVGLCGLHAEGLLLQPAWPRVGARSTRSRRRLDSGDACRPGAWSSPLAQFARRLAENGCQVLVPR